MEAIEFNKRALTLELYVDPKYVRSGVGTLLLRSIEAEAVSLGISTLKLESTATAQSFYALHGFVDSGSPVLYRGVTAYPMEKQVPSREH